MKRMSKKLAIVSLWIGIGLTSSIYASVLHSVRTEQTVTKGATHINEKILTEDGWRNVNILRVNLADSNIEVKPIESTSGLQRQTVLQMVQDSGAVAGVNADYFDMQSSSAPSLGMLIDEGVLKHGYNSNYSSLGINKNMATFMIDYNHMPSMAYYGVTIKISSNGTVVGGMATKNIVPSSVKQPIVLDGSYYHTTNNVIAAHPTLYTIVVENNSVTYLSNSGESVMIPENGYVILVPEASANEYYSQLPIGSHVELQEILYLNDGFTTAVNMMKLGIGGSGIIMRNGAAYTGAAHAVTPKANVARTVVATMKDSQDILLVTIDKGNGYIGINQEELVALLKCYNVQDAMYLDGGGSTTCVVRNQGDVEATLQNHPTDGAQRKVINGIGIFSVGMPTELTYLEGTPSSKRTFVGNSITINYKGSDANRNPVDVDASQISYSVVGIEGNFSGNIFTPTTAGKGLIVANYGMVESVTEIDVSEAPKGIIVEPHLIQLTLGTPKTLTAYGVDAQGNKIPLQAEQVIWNSNHPQISINQNTVSASAEVVGEITATYNGITGKAGVVVGKVTRAVESFENHTGYWGAMPSHLEGDVFNCSSPVYEGSKSLKMAYTFKASKEKQVAYTVLNEPIEVPIDASRVNLWLYGKNQGHAAKVVVVDSTGKAYSIKLTDNIDFTGWKYVSAALPKDMVLPAKVTKFCVASSEVPKDITTAVYFDHVSITRGFRDAIGLSSKADYLADPFYKESLQDPIGHQYIINVVGPTKVDGVALDHESLTRIGNQLSAGAGLIIQASSHNSDLALNSEKYTYTNTYQAGSFNQTKVILLGTGSGGIRTTDVKGWGYLKESIQKSGDAKNIIIVTSLNPLTEFKDTLEGKAFHDYLVEVKQNTNQNIFVVYAGATTPEVCLEDGIRYIKTNGLSTPTDNYQDGSFVKFKMDDGVVYYTIEKFN